MSPCNEKQKAKGCTTIYDDKGDVKGCYDKNGEKCQVNQNDKKYPKISNKYRIKYLSLLKGGADSNIYTSMDDLIWTNEQSFKKYNHLLKKIGAPSKICKNTEDKVEYVIWQDPYNNVDFGKYGGLDYLKLTDYHAKKWHPKPANVFIIAGKYLQVPDNLLGPLKFASETINIEQLFVEKEANDKFGESGEKDLALVTGSCASIDISTITLAFVEDMISKYSDKKLPKDINQIMKTEYDKE